MMRLVPFDDLDDLMIYFDEGYKISQDEAYRRFSEIKVVPPEDLPSDPFSAAYSNKILEIYKKASSRNSYSIVNEVAGFNVDELTVRPFPFFTKSIKLAAQHYSLIGKFLGMMDIKSGGSILECGVGFGNTTLALAMLGCQVTALDIAESYCEVVRRRAALHEVDIKVVHSDFTWIETTEEKYDAVCFFESFHHCWEFERILLSLHKVVKPGGKIYFGGEPINMEFPMPWGVRLDGEALFVVRQNGWMELGFHSDFFEELLFRTGWRGTCVDTHFWYAARKYDPIVISGSDSKIGSNFGTAAGDALHIDVPVNSQPTFVVYGPYLKLAKGKYRFEYALDPDAQVADTMVVDICYSAGQNVIYARQITQDDLTKKLISGEFTLNEKANDLEIRLMVSDGFRAGIRQLSVQPLD
ncbi:class I SAM-dependent methyltransferase [Azospirillum sp. CT11-132]|jgi:2-polyprenyl-3-methyl-5-hydroxy-6-metoxy-1,4-benzoquinol methylase|uniref:class I SAM-dependent methyltransferase n=1 Tax=Azospirillum sp. CT11-132 TaxID=3396317 RepID=UPI0039A4A6D1